MLTEEELKLLKLYAENDMCAERASSKAYIHRNTLKYRLRKIHRKTGLDPERFFDLCKLIGYEPRREALI